MHTATSRPTLRKKYIFTMFSIVMLLLACLVGVRDETIGTDTANYINFFQSVSFESGRFEWGFKLFTLLIKLITDDPRIFLASIFIFVYAFMFFTYLNIIGNQNRDAFTLSSIFLTCLLASDWFFVATLNGLRQGMALSLIYFSISLLYLKKHKSAYLTLLLSIFFHQTSITFLPFFYCYDFLILNLVHITS